MLFDHNITRAPSELQCPDCKGELQPSFLLPVLHNACVAVEFLAITLMTTLLSFLAIHRIMVHMNIDYSTLPAIDWGNVAKILLVGCLGVGLIISRFLQKRHWFLTYWVMDHTMKEARYCPKCSNRFLVLLEETLNMEPEDT